MIQKSISIYSVIRKVVNDLGIGDKELSMDDFIEWIAEGMQYIGSYYQYTEKYITIPIDNYKGELPCDFYSLLRITNNLGNNYNSFNKHLIGDDSTSINKGALSTRDYNITNNVITTSFVRGNLHLQYLAIPTDCDGLPMIPDVVDYQDALMWRCAYQLSLRGHTFKQSQLNDLNFTKSMWYRYCNQARAVINMPDVDALERIKNIMIRFKPDLNQYHNGFESLGKQEVKNTSINKIFGRN